MKNAKRLLNLLRKKEKTIFFAESFTGGLATSSIAAIPGASKVLMGGITAYHPDVKKAILKVAPSVVNDNYAVNEKCCLAMLDGAREIVKADYYASFTGFAGDNNKENKDGYGFIGVGYYYEKTWKTIVQKIELPDGRIVNQKNSVANVFSILVNIIEGEV